MAENTLYEEHIRSTWTRGDFVALAFIFALLASWRAGLDKPGVWVYVFLLLALVFIFYTFNYGTLIIRITGEGVYLHFGLFKWLIPLDNIEACELDNDIPALYKYGGAGIHWYAAHGKYRASWNMLEHPRVVLRFKERVGRAVEVSFSTTKPDEVISTVNRIMAEN